jgi:outer membrane protein TolC
VAVLAVSLAGCALSPEPLTEAETTERITEDRVALFADQEPVAGPVSLHEAMARAIRYNLDNRLKVMEEALAQQQIDVARYDMLPDVVGGAGFEGRNNESAASSESVITRQQSLEPSTSQDQERGVADLSVTWNVLDFGVSYMRARQQANRALIAYERRRKVVHNIIQDVRSAYWRAVAAERLLDRLEPLRQRIEQARDDSAAIERLRLQSPLDALRYRRTLIDALRQVEALRRELMLAKAQLAALMNLPPGTDYELVMPPADERPVPELAYAPDELQEAALRHRPELREEAYQTRIGADETRRAMLEMLPGLQFDAGVNYDSNSFLVNTSWIDYGLRVSWNLFSLISGPANVRAAEVREEVVYTRRLALSMAVLTQVQVAVLQYRQARDEYRIADELSTIEDEILQRVAAAGRVQRLGELEIILSEMDAVIATLRRDLAYAELQNAAGRVFVSVGADPLPEAVPAADIPALTTAIQEVETGWYQGRLFPAADPGEENGVAELEPTS